MIDLIASAEALRAVVLFSVVALLTVSAVLLWEAYRRWVRSRTANRTLEKVFGSEGSSSVAGEPGRDPSSLLIRTAGKGPRWLEAVVLALPHREDLQRLLDQAGVRWSPGSVVLASAGAAVAFGLVASVVGRGPVLPMLAAGAGAVLPFAYLRWKRSRRFRAFEEHFPEAIDLMARAARAGHSLAAGLKVVGEEGEEPVAGEFRTVYEEQRFGLPLKDSLMALADRVEVVDVRIFVTSVLIQRESGGNLAENLDGLSAVIRGRFRFKRDVKTKTAHGRVTGTVVGLAPVVAGFGMYALNPDYMAPLIQEPLGRAMLLVGGTMMALGFGVIRRMVDVKF